MSKTTLVKMTLVTFMLGMLVGASQAMAFLLTWMILATWLTLDVRAAFQAKQVVVVKV